MKPTAKTTGATATASSAEIVGTKFGGDFRILRRLGQGGMGQVFLAEQISLKRKVAIKLLREEVAANPIVLQRFKAESKNVAQLSHPNVVQVYLIGEDEGRPYMVLEYVEGKSLGEYLVRQGPLEVLLVVSLMRQIASTLQCASELGIVHRDVKPANILLTRKGQAKVADFGLSCCTTPDEAVDLTRTGMTVGTPLYMSPEQIEGKTVDFRSDVYSFGVTCYHMLAGRSPFAGSNGFEIALKHVREEPVPLEEIRPDVPTELCDVVRKMMAKKPKARYPTARELLEDVARVRATLGGATASMSVSKFSGADSDPDVSRATAVPFWKQPAFLWLSLAMSVVVVLTVLMVGIGIGLRGTAARRAAANPPGPSVPANGAGGNVQQKTEAELKKEREEALKKVTGQYLALSTPDKAGVDACIELGVLYLDQNRIPEAETLFKRMDGKRIPAEYHFVGHLGVAITEAFQKKYRTSHGKIVSLFDSKSKDNRVQILNQYLTKHPEFANWANEADSVNVRNGANESSIPQKLRNKFGKNPFKKS